MANRIRRWERVPGGFQIDVEIGGAYNDGSSRLEQVFVTRDEMRGKSGAERRQAIVDALSDAPLDGIEDALATQPSQTKAILEARMVALYEDWRRWQATRIEAQARGLAAGVITSLTNRENAVWDNYAAAILDWRNAPSS